jgi:hypothetical protein
MNQISKRLIQNIYNFIPPFLILLISYLVLKPVFSMSLDISDYEQFKMIATAYGKDISIFKIPFEAYYSIYGTLFIYIALVYQIFSDNALAFYTINFALRTAAAISIYFLVYRWTKNKFSGLIAGVIFAVSYVGLESTQWVMHFSVYIAIIGLVALSLVWRRYSKSFSNKDFILLALTYLLTLFILPVRLQGLPLVIFTGQIYLLLKQKGKKKRRTVTLHTTAIVLTTFLGYYILTQLGNSFFDKEASGKIVEPLLLLKALISGNPPVFSSYIFIVGNLFTPPKYFQFLLGKFSVLTPIFTHNIITLLLIFISLVLILILLLKKKVWIASLSVLTIIIPISLYLSKRYLIAWEYLWIISAAIGGWIFSWMIIFLISNWKKYQKISEVGFLGVVILLSHLISPWALNPLWSPTDQSVFDAFHRYQTLPMMGASLLIASCISLFILKNKKLRKTSKSNLYKITNHFVAMLIFLSFFSLLYFYSSTTFSTLKYLVSSGGKNRFIYDSIWNSLNPHIKRLSDTDSLKVIYIPYEKVENKNYYLNALKYKIYLQELPISSPYQIVFVYNIEDLKSALTSAGYYTNENISLKFTNSDDWLALKIIGNQYVDVKEEILILLNNDVN